MHGGKGLINSVGKGKDSLPAVASFTGEVEETIKNGGQVPPLKWAPLENESENDFSARTLSNTKRVSELCVSLLWKETSFVNGETLKSVPNLTDDEKAKLNVALQRKFKTKCNWVKRKRSNRFHQVELESTSDSPRPKKKKTLKLIEPSASHRSNGQFKSQAEMQTEQHDIPSSPPPLENPNSQNISEY